MKKNVASQVMGAQLISKTDGSAVTTGTTTIYITGDAGTQAAGSVGSGACTHEGNGYWTYAPAQAETNYDQIGATFVNTSACNVTIQYYTTYPQTGDSFGRLGAPAGASIAADLATAQADLDLITGADGATLATAQPSITFQPMTITASDGIPNLTLSGSGAADGIAFTRTGSGNPFDAEFAAQIQSECNVAIVAYDPATGTEVGTLQTSVNDLPTNAELATALGTADDAVLAQVALVKAKTDQMVFTKANELDVNLQSVNDVTINGDGAATPMGV